MNAEEREPVANSWVVIVPPGARTVLPDGRQILLSGVPGNCEVRGFTTDQGPVIEVVCYQNSGGALTDEAVSPGARRFYPGPITLNVS